MAKKSVASPKVKRFRPLFDKEGMEKGEARMNGPGDVAVCRRVTLAVLTRSQSELEENWKEDSKDECETMFEMIKAVQAFIDHTSQTLKFAELALHRLFLTGQNVHPSNDGVSA